MRLLRLHAFGRADACSDVASHSGTDRNSDPGSDGAADAVAVRGPHVGAAAGADPDADADGYVAYPNVNVLEEMVDLMTTARTYEANANVLEVTDTMATTALEIGR